MSKVHVAIWVGGRVVFVTRTVGLISRGGPGAQVRPKGRLFNLSTLRRNINDLAIKGHKVANLDPAIY